MGASRRIRRRITRRSQREAIRDLEAENAALQQELSFRRQQELQVAAAEAWLDELESANELEARGIDTDLDVGEPGELTDDEQALVDAGLAAFRHAREQAEA